MELLAVMCILSILMFLGYPKLEDYRQRVSEAQCMANMRTITTALHSYLQDNQNIWPQGPSPEAGAEWESFWLRALNPYGIPEKTWQCPSTDRSSDLDSPRVHYKPTMFPGVPGIATKWPTHPWLIERGQGHGHGALICFSDGSVKSLDKVLAELGLR